MRCETVKVISNEKIATNIYILTLPFPHSARAGQFVMLKEPYATTLLPRPISICNIENDTIKLLYQVVGKGTEQYSHLKPNDSITITGPIGHGFPVEEVSGRVALVGGGVGTAPLLYTAKKLREKGIYASIYLGFRNEAYLMNEFAKNSDRLTLSTEDGSVGTKGFVTAELDPSKYDYVFCCGPTPMMKAVTTLCEEAGTPIYVSLENKMACGIGACRVCTCTTKEKKNLRTCMEGPVFLGEEIDFDA